jgi:hypothetical protein
MVGVLVSPYAWQPDELLFLPGLHQRFREADAPARAFLVAANLVALALLKFLVPLGPGAYLWTV